MARVRKRLVLVAAVLAVFSIGLWWSNREPQVVGDTGSFDRAGRSKTGSGSIWVVGAASIDAAPESMRPSHDLSDSGGDEVTGANSDAGLAEAGLMRVLALNRAAIECEAQKLCGDGVCRVWTGSERIACFRSNCALDGGNTCGPGDWCQDFGSVMRCAPDGAAKFGASCLPDRFANRSQRCSQGLACVAGVCSHACTSSSECSGSLCVAFNGAHYCLPEGATCTHEADCSDGRVCVGGVCARRMELRPGVQSCIPGGCPRDQVCDGELVGSSIWAECRPLCRNKQCESGARCVASNGLAGNAEVCEPLCPCGMGEACRFRADAPQEGTCRPTSPTDSEMSSLFEWEEAFSGKPDGFPAAGQ